MRPPVERPIPPPELAGAEGAHPPDQGLFRPGGRQGQITGDDRGLRVPGQAGQGVPPPIPHPKAVQQIPHTRGEEGTSRAIGAPPTPRAKTGVR